MIRKINEANNLLYLYPEVGKLLHPLRNAIEASDIFPFTKTKYWWFDPICKHEYLKSPCSAVACFKQAKKYGYKSRGCPVCHSLVVNETNCAANTHPWMLDLVHPSLNTETLYDVTAGSDKVFWWKCKYGHEWQSPLWTIKRRELCGKCHPSISLPQLFIYCEIKSIFPDAELGKKIDGIEFDIFINEIQLGIEYDGRFWHKNRQDKDFIKNEKAAKIGITILRVRETGLGRLSLNDVFVDMNIRKRSYNHIAPILLAIKNMNFACNSLYYNNIDMYINNRRLQNDNLFESLRYATKNSCVQNNITETHAYILKSWGENLPLLPQMFTAGSSQIINWICDRNSNHQWKTSIGSRCLRNSGCLKCRDVDNTSCLEFHNIEIAGDWNFSRNTDTPYDISYGSQKRRYWICKKGHEEYLKVRDRVRNFGCLTCKKLQKIYC